MRRTSSFSGFKRAAVAALILACGAVWSVPASAEPPPWAPAWGYRAKHKGKNKHRVQQAYLPPYDIGLGRCNRDLIGGLLGGAAGGLLGSQIGKGRGQLAAVAAGTLLGFLVGNNIGRSMDQADQTCLTQSLEHAEDGQKIVWKTRTAAPAIKSHRPRPYGRPIIVTAANTPRPRPSVARPRLPTAGPAGSRTVSWRLVS